MAQQLTVHPCKSLIGNADVPADKSISHRAIMFASIAKGKSRIRNYLRGSDCLATKHVMSRLGATINESANTELTLAGNGIFGLKEAQNILDCANSGTTIRLLTGLLAGQKFISILSGSEQIRRRPMNRVIDPLRTMGAQVFGRQNNRLAPICVLPSSALNGVDYNLPIASAQIKSCLLLAGLYANSPTHLVEPGPARDHTERMLAAMGAPIFTNTSSIVLAKTENELSPIDIDVPADPSSAAFLLVAGSVVPKSTITMPRVLANHTRTGLIDTLKLMGANITSNNQNEHCGEPIEDIIVTTSTLKGVTVSGDLVVRMIDELPILAVAATQAHGITIVKDAAELKVKETNRIDTTVNELRKMGACIEATEDGFIVEGPTPLIGALVDSHDDHRLAMMLTIAGLVASGTTTVQNAHVTVDSFPGFESCLRNLGAHIEERE